MRKKITVSGTKLDPKHYSIALLPLRDWLCNSNEHILSKLQAIDSVMLYPLPTLEERLKVRKEIIGETEDSKNTRRRSTRSNTTRRSARSDAIKKEVTQKLKF